MQLAPNKRFVAQLIRLNGQCMYHLIVRVASLSENTFAAAATICKTLVPGEINRRLAMRLSRVLNLELLRKVRLLTEANPVCCIGLRNVRQPSFVV